MRRGNTLTPNPVRSHIWTTPCQLSIHVRAMMGNWAGKGRMPHIPLLWIALYISIHLPSTYVAFSRTISKHRIHGWSATVVTAPTYTWHGVTWGYARPLLKHQLLGRWAFRTIGTSKMIAVYMSNYRIRRLRSYGILASFDVKNILELDHQ